MSDDLATGTPPWGNVPAPSGRKVTWGKAADTAPDSAPAPRRGSRAERSRPRDADVRDHSAAPSGFGDVFDVGAAFGRQMPPPPADPFAAPVDVDPFGAPASPAPASASASATPDEVGFSSVFTAPAEPAQGSGFGGVFEPDTAVPGTPDYDAADPGEAGTGGGFGDVFAAVSAAAPQPAGADVDTAPEGSAGAPAPFGALFAGAPTSSAGELTSTEPTADAAPARDDAATHPVSSPVPAEPTAITDNSPASNRRLNLAARREAQDAARAEREQAVSPEVARLARADRYARAPELHEMVKRILAAGVGGSTALSNFTRSAQLTRDHALDRTQRVRYEEIMAPLLADAGVRFQNPADHELLFDMAYDEQIGIGPLGPLWRDDSISEIMVSGPSKVTIERNGRLEVTPVTFLDLDHLRSTVRALSARSADDRAVSRVNPLVTIQLPGARVQFVQAPLAVAGVAISIRKFGALMDMDRLLQLGALSEQMAQFLSDAVLSRATVLVSGGTGSGKTTFINALSGFIPDSERVVTIEDALELQLRNTHVESFVTKEAASSDDEVFFGQDDLLKATLRMRPDRIIVGEIRDAAGCAVMLEAANTGHDGTMTTLHANTPRKAVERMTKLLRKGDAMPHDVARAEVTDAIDVIVQIVKERGRRFVSEIALVESHDEGEAQVAPLFVGTFPRDAEAPVFRRECGLRPDTDLASKMTEAGVDPTTWE